MSMSYGRPLSICIRIIKCNHDVTGAIICICSVLIEDAEVIDINAIYIGCNSTIMQAGVS